MWALVQVIDMTPEAVVAEHDAALARDKEEAAEQLGPDGYAAYYPTRAPLDLGRCAGGDSTCVPLHAKLAASTST